jgi:hypothetical protein
VVEKEFGYVCLRHGLASYRDFNRFLITLPSASIRGVSPSRSMTRPRCAPAFLRAIVSKVSMRSVENDFAGYRLRGSDHSLNIHLLNRRDHGGRLRWLQQQMRARLIHLTDFSVRPHRT